MKARVRTFAAILCVSSSFLGCSKDEKSTPTPPPPYVDISASAPTVVANGVNSVTLSVIDTGGGPVSVTTTRGTFAGVGGQNASVPGASGTLTLVTCDAATSATCAGTAVIAANSTSGSDSVSVSFGTLAAACLSSCDADPGCATLACSLPAGGSGTCSSTTPSTCLAAPACTATETPEATCSDGEDNDCDGDVDCADTDCADRICDVSSPTFLCKSTVCEDTTSGLAIQVTPARTRLPAVTGASTAISVKVTSAGEPVQGMAVSISTSPTGFGTLSAATGTTLADGTVTFTLTLPGTVGVATVTASLTAVPQIADTATVTVPRLGSFQLSTNPGPVQYPVMGAKESGWNELGWIQVQVLDDVGEPYPDGLPVRFEHRVLGGSTLGPPLTADVGACVAPACVGYQGVTISGDGPPAGLAKAYLYSGRVAGTLAVSATATADGVSRAITLPTVAVVGAKASGTNFSVVCGPRNVPALAETDCAISLVEAPFTCAALLKDRYDNLLGTATQVIFAAEAGAIGPVTTTPAYDPAKPPTGQADLGTATQIVNTLGAGLPFDVAPFPGPPGPPFEARVDHDLDGCGLRTHNPRDGLVTVVAIADGEEAFFDANGNGVYDAPTVTPGDPFVDQGEPFVDQDDSGAWEAGEWFLDLDGDGAYDLPNGVWDANAKIWTQTVVVYTGTPATMLSGVNLLGTRWATDASFMDACTATPAPPLFSVTAAQTGPPPVAATSAPHWVVGSDMNLNRLASGTTYAVTVESGTVTVDYQGFPKYADSLGMFYRYWPCDQGSVCASQCRSTASPCLMIPSIDTYSCGIAAPAIVWGGSSPDVGTDRVDWTVTTPYSVYGTDKTEIQTRSLFGTSN